MDHIETSLGPHAGEAPRAVLSEEQQRELLAVILDTSGNSADMWEQLRSLPAVQQRLQFATQLVSFTGNNMPLIKKVLQDPSLSSAADLVRLDAAAWAGLIAAAQDGQANIPAGVKGKTAQERLLNYATGLADAIQAALPGQAVAHLLQTDTSVVPNEPVREGVVRFLANCPEFDPRNTRISRYVTRDIEKAFAGIDPGSKADVTAQLRRIQRALQLGGGTHMTATLLRRGLDSAHKIANIPRRSFLDQHGEALGGKGPATGVYERALSVNSRSLLLYSGLNDAKNGITPRAIGGAGHAADMAQLEATLVKQVPDYAELFGAMDLCQCEDCRSVLSPAAYLVDLLRFLAMSTPNAAGLTPLDVLLARRPDIATIELTCENTNTSLPYIDLVNEILEAWVVSQGQPLVSTILSSGSVVAATSISTAAPIPAGSTIKLGTGAGMEFATTGAPSGAGPYTIPVTGAGSGGTLVNAHSSGDPVSQMATANNTADATSAALDANPQYVLEQAYVTLAGQPYPFSLPFNQPVAEARTYLRNLGTSRFEIISSFQAAPSTASARACSAEYLGITREQFQLLTAQDFDPGSALQIPPLSELYGYSATPPANWEQDVGKVPTFLSRTGIGYSDLVEFVGTRFVNPAYPQGADGELFAKIPLDYPSLASLVQHQFNTTDQNILNALAAAGITLADLQAWCNRHFSVIGSVLVLDNPDGDCDLATTVLTHLGDTGADPAVSSVSTTELNGLQQLIRLRNYLGWATADIDRTMSARGASNVTPALITDLAWIQQLSASLGNVSIQVLLALWAPLDPWGPGSLYQQLFLNPATLPIDPAFQPNPDGSVLTDSAQLLEGHIPALLAAFNVTSTDLALIRADAGLDADTATLSGVSAGLPATANISTLYRYAALAQLLGLPVADLIALRTLAGAGLDPFSSPSAAVAFAGLVRLVQASGFSPVLLNYLFRHVSAPPTGLAPQQPTLLTLASRLRQGLAAITTQTSVAADPAGTLTQATLTQLISKDVADQATAMINGTALYTTPLTALPPAIALTGPNGQVLGINPAALPPVVASKVSYDPAGSTLSFTGAMAATEQNALLGAAPDANFQSAVNNLAHQPLTFIADALAGVVDPAQADSTLVTAMPSLDAHLHPLLIDANGGALIDANGDPVTDPTRPPSSTAAAAKRAFVLGSALPFLGRQLSHALAKQTMVDALGLDPATATALLETTLVSPADPTQLLVADLLALGTPGLTAEYYTTASPDSLAMANANADIPLGPPPRRVVTVPTLGSPDQRMPPVTTIPPGTQSARWRAWLLPQVTGTYTFTIVSPGSVRLWVGDDSTPGGLALTQDPASGAFVGSGVGLTAGQLTPLRLEVTGIPQQAQLAGGVAELFWQCPTIAKTVVPAASLMPAGIFDNFALAYTRLQKAALLVSTFGLTPAELSYLTTHPADFAGLDLNNLPLTRTPATAGQADQQAVQLFAWWQRLQAYVTLRNSLPGGQVHLTDVFAAASLADAQTLLAQTTGWDPGLLADLINGFGLANGTANPLTSETWPAALRRCQDIAARTGASAAQLFSWGRYDLTVADLQVVAEDIKKAARSRYDAATWLTVAKPLNDTLRTAQRDALVSFALQALGRSSPNELFEVFLIDPEMGSCMETSRISQAVGSVQLFVQRCLMNLETEVSPSAIDADTWRQWMSQYALWGANREVFLYPENWLVPSLRDDITPFFADIQSAVAQNQVTADNTEAWFLTYLKDLEQVARLDIRGVYWQDTDPDTGDVIDTLHVFGRTFHTPRQYFYRRLLNASTTPQWTAWEQVPLDIQSDHLVPVVWNRRLRVIWPVFTEQALPQASGTVNYDSAKGTATTSDSSQKYWKITLAWSEYVQGTWQPKQVSDDFLLSLIGEFGSIFAIEPLQSQHVFKARVDGDDLVVDLFVAINPSVPQFVGEFRFAAFGSAVTVGYGPSVASPAAWPNGVEQSPHPEHGSVADAQMTIPANAMVSFNGIDQRFDTTSVLDLPGWTSDDPTGSPVFWSRFFSRTPTLFDLRFPQQYWQLQPGPFFYQDQDRTFFAMGGLGRFVGYVLRFSTHRHPYVPELIKALARRQGPAQTGGVSGLLNTASQTFGNPYLGPPWTRAETLPDPGTGPAAMIQGDYGTGPDLDFEAIVLEGTSLVHYFRSNSQPGTPWVRGNLITARASGPGSLVQSGTAVNGHGPLNVVVPEQLAPGVIQLAHYVGQAAPAGTGSARPAVNWTGAVGTATLPPGSVVGPASLATITGPAFNGLGLVVLEGTELRYWIYDGTGWQQPGTSAITVQAAAPGTLIESGGEVHVVVAQSAAAGASPPWELHYYHGDTQGQQWAAGSVISTAASGAASLIASDISDGLATNLEVIVPEGGSGSPWNLVHYWLDESLSGITDPATFTWHAGQVVTTKATGPGCLIQSSYGKDAGAANGNFEIVAIEGGSVVHYTHSNSNHIQWADLYQPNTYQGAANGPETGFVAPPYPVEDIDFSATGAYSIYNWELFFHAPMLIATTLSQNQQFADADAWFRYVFDPTNDSPDELIPQRYWKVLPFKTTPAESISELMTALDQGDASAATQVSDWHAHPFAPFRIARLRVTAFQRWVFMKYLDNLIAWGDHLFAQNTRESINQATQLYVLAADLLGPRPELVPVRTAMPVQTYAQLQPELDAFSNVMELLENEFPFATQTPPPDPNADTAGLLGLSRTLFFGIPQNSTMLGYWDTVTDRLFKVRNCMNLQGAVERLPLFQPIANPALLVQAAAAGVDLGSVLTDMNTPPPNYRFSYLLSKAVELCGDVRAFGGALLAALEKGDAEGLALLRATQETQILNALESTKQDHVTELSDTVSSLQTSRTVAWGRYSYYQMLLGVAQSTEPAVGTTIADYPVPTQDMTTNGGIELIQEEKSELDASHDARDQQTAAGIIESLAGFLHLIPDFSVDVQPFGIGLSLETGGTALGLWAAAGARVLQTIAAKRTYDASHAARMAGYFRRWQDWALQSNQASGEIMRIDNDIAAASLRVSIAQQELAVHRQQILNAQKIQDTLTSKYTNQQLYQWMVDQACGLYFQLYQMAYSAAKQAERALDNELGTADTNYIQFGYWDSLRRGLMSGERLLAGLRQLEQAYLSQNKREYEITRNVSLLLNAPTALIALKETGQCVVEFPEEFFDMDYPGQYFRRLKSVSLTVPCVVGPYTSVNCTLTLLAHKIRTSPDPSGDYAEILNKDPRFQYTFAATQSIATSHAQNDSGVFDINFRDERYLPFETAGAISRWRISMPPQCNAFDFSTMTDVIFRLNYTARDGGDLLRQKAFAAATLPPGPKQSAPGQVGARPPQQDLGRLFSAKHEFPTEWYGLVHPASSSGTYAQMPLWLTMDRFPFQYRGRTITITGFDLYLTFQAGGQPSITSFDLYLTAPTGPPPQGNPPAPPTPNPQTDKVTLSADPLLNGTLHGTKAFSGANTTVPNYWWLAATATGASDSIASIVDQIDDILVICRYSVG